ncbi:MAG TPA: MFS transporter [Candidatus Acidoferrales bacterium]|nr:MFS transporter [Candidatus Acidoferrales bacterium]
MKKFFGSFHPSFWVANSLELFERLAYYAQAAVMSIFLRDYLNFNEIDATTLSSIFGLLVYLLPIFAGTFADKYGFRKAFSFAFLVMAIGYFLIGAIGSPFFRPLIHDMSLFWLIVAVLVFTSVGESFIKPSVLGTVAFSTNRETKSLGYAIYYTLVNVGGATGPVIAYFVRSIVGIQWVYMVSALSCAMMLAGTILFYRVPESATAIKQPSVKTKLADMARVLINARFMVFLLIFSLYWVTFWQIFITLPYYITDFIARKAPFDLIESIDAWSIIFLQVVINRLTKKMPPITAIVLGFFVSSLCWFVIAARPSIPGVIAAMVVWSLGEMSMAPRYYEYIADQAPRGQEALFQGYAFLPIALGYFAGGIFGGRLYASLAKPAIGEPNPAEFWIVFGIIGIIGTVLMVAYNWYLTRKKRSETAPSS